MGLFVHLLADIGIDSTGAVFLRCGVAALCHGVLLLCFAAGFITCFFPYLLYTYGLTGQETGQASVMASIEPVVATLVGIFIFFEPLSLMVAIGILLVLGAIVLLNLNFEKKQKS